MDYRKFMASLSAEQKKNLTAKTNKQGVLNLMLHFGLIVLFALLIVLDTPLKPVFMLVQGILIVFLFTLLHETIHKSAFASARINQMAGLVSSYLIFLPVKWFKYFHFEHHRHTHIPGKDPELDSPKPTTIIGYLWHVSGIGTWRFHIQTLFNNAFATIDYRYVPTSSHPDLRREARIMILIYTTLLLISVLTQSMLLLEIWLIPILLGQPFLRLYLMAEHDRCPFVSNMFENTRTTFTNSVVKKLAWNMPYHTEHHTYPSVPFHKLPELNRLIQSYLQETEHGYIRFNRKYIASFKHQAALKQL